MSDQNSYRILRSATEDLVIAETRQRQPAAELIRVSHRNSFTRRLSLNDGL